MLCTLLGSHEDVLCHHELFNPRGVFYALELRDGSFDLGRDRASGIAIRSASSSASGRPTSGTRTSGSR